MDPAQALADLTEVSSQIRGAVIVEGEGALVASTYGDERGERVAAAAAALLAAAEEMPREAGRADLMQLEAATDGGSVFVLRDGTRAIAATTVRNPTTGLVFYDLKTALRLAFADEGTKDGRKSAGRERKNDAGA